MDRKGLLVLGLFVPVVAGAQPPARLAPGERNNGWGVSVTAMVAAGGSDVVFSGGAGGELAVLHRAGTTVVGPALGLYSFHARRDPSRWDVTGIVPSLVVRYSGGTGPPAPSLILTVGWYSWHETWHTWSGVYRSSYGGPGGSIGGGLSLLRLSRTAGLGIEIRGHLFALDGIGGGFLTFGARAGSDPPR